MKEEAVHLMVRYSVKNPPGTYYVHSPLRVKNVFLCWMIEELVIQLMVNKIGNIRLHRWDSLTTDRNLLILVMRSLWINKLILLTLDEWMQTIDYYTINLRIPVTAKRQKTKRTSFGHRCILFIKPSVSLRGATSFKFRSSGTNSYSLLPST